MTIDEKFEEWKDVFFDKFVKVSSDGCEQGSCVPLEEIDLERSRGYVGDGTINLALMMTYLALAEKARDETPISIFSCLQTLDRLHEAALELYKPFKMVSDRFQDAVTGFFLRDDIDPYGWEGLDTVVSAYGMFHHIDEDPCASPFTSQDQVWNLSPILMYLAASLGYIDATDIGYDMNAFIKDNGYKVTNPYLSWINHYHSYLPSMNESKVKAWEREEDREKHFKYDVKVKRGANNWYYSGGTKANVDAFKKGKYEHDLRTFLYRSEVLFLDRVWWPLVRFVGAGAKENAIYCYAATSGIWYNKKFKKRLSGRFNDSLTEGMLFGANVAPLVCDPADIDWEAVDFWLDAYPSYSEIDKEENIWSPIEFMIVYEWRKLNR